MRYEQTVREHGNEHTRKKFSVQHICDIVPKYMQ